MTMDNGMHYTQVIGNDYAADTSAGFKGEVKHVFESYMGQGVDLANDMLSVITSPASKQSFIDSLLESVTTSPLFTNSECSNQPFYNNYAQRAEKLIENSLNTVATESAMIGYAPIVSYNPFFLKKQWIECVFKDVLMTEVPATPVINLGFQKHFLKSLAGKEYALPESLYDDKIMAELNAEATGLAIKEDPIPLPLKNTVITNATYIPGVVTGDQTVELTPDLCICAVTLTDTESAETDKPKFIVPCNIRVDITTHNFIKGVVSYDVKDTDGKVLRTISDELIGNVNFKDGSVTVMATGDKATAVTLRGKIANRFNQRSLDVIRRVEPLQYVMPESGPRLNSAVTIEDAADALVLQNIDVIADNIDIMGRTLANFEDSEIKMFLKNSFDTQKKAQSGPHGYASMIVEGNFDALPYETFTGNVSQWMKDSREYFERVLGGLKTKLKTPDAIVVIICHPNLIRFLQDGINWVFTDDTQISGMKIAYNFGIYTSAQDRVHVITSLRMNEDDGIDFVVIPLTKELATFKHYKYNTVIDRNYRNPLYTLTPNIMCTHRTLTFEVLPVQGRMTITGRDTFSPETLKRKP